MDRPCDAPSRRTRSGSHRWCRLWADFIRDTRAATAVEVAMITPCFLAMVLAWIEVGLCLLMLSTLDNAARDASRLLRIGSVNEATFKAAICAKASPVIPCDKIVYYVQSGTSFASLSPATSTSAGGLSKTGFNSGSSGSDVILQIGYSKAPLSGMLKGAGFDTHVLLLTTLSFQNEPY
ncbi:TadE/TadG family type IV pilus assembly protein [Methylobacterium sp. Leaf113]|uniref:TadE/TadG family type IV pilus assembly protein n=1 Tax=Methylobacterium sp. Leaf113 TaxID=1736259 RepID=UPI0009E7FCDF|nr:TadE/TadG family type IV pilus assembly protein [Methylobacterium sp. Leaf113]